MCTFSLFIVQKNEINYSKKLPGSTTISMYLIFAKRLTIGVCISDKCLILSQILMLSLNAIVD